MTLPQLDLGACTVLVVPCAAVDPAVQASGAAGVHLNPFVFLSMAEIGHERHAADMLLLWLHGNLLLWTVFDAGHRRLAGEHLSFSVHLCTRKQRHLSYDFC